MKHEVIIDKAKIEAEEEARKLFRKARIAMDEATNALERLALVLEGENADLIEHAAISVRLARKLTGMARERWSEKL